MAALGKGAEDGLRGPDEGPSSEGPSEGSSPDSTPSPSRPQPDFSWGPGGGSTHEGQSLLPQEPDARPGGHRGGAPEPPENRDEPGGGAGQWRTLVSWKNLSRLLAVALVIVCGLWFYYFLNDAGGSREPREPCPDVWMYYAKYCYYYAEDETDWKSAKKSCEANQASLVTFRDKLEMDFILKRAGKRSYWVGLRKREKVLEWITGDLLDDRQFQTQGHEECGFIWSKNGLVISLSTCSLPRSSICKREPYS
ncbi:C-type lectin domain family 2 member L-like [Lissotriton helveticus]